MNSEFQKKKQVRFLRWKYLAKSAVPGIAFVFIPKCPFCLAAYISMISGLSISATTAGLLRFSLIAICIASFAYFGYMTFFRSGWLVKKKLEQVS